MPVPNIYRRGGSVLANYDSQDLVTGTGYLSLNGFIASGAVLYNLTNQTFNSQQIASYKSTGSGTDVKLLDLDFDIEVKRSLLIKGPVIVSIPFKAGQSGGSNTISKINFDLKRVRGANSTSLTAASGAYVQVNAGTTTYFNDCVSASIDKAKNLAVGDILRLSVTQIQRANGGGTALGGIGHDPNNRSSDTWASDDWGTTPTQLKLLLPIKIDI